MQILGSLLKLPDDPSSLPLPWWHRSPLGLLHGTSVYVALVESAKRPVGDFVVSVLNPESWGNMVRVECKEDDKPGILAKVFNAVLPLNIAVAETVTAEGGGKHIVNLVCEPYGDHAVKRSVIEKSLRRAKVQEYKVESFLLRVPNVLWHEVTEIDRGWLRAIDWRGALLKHYPDAEKSVDLSKVVVSADTQKRLLRFVFPYKEAISVTTEHADIPGALTVLSQSLADCNYNVLSALLRRGGAKKGNAVLVAVCEPKNPNEKGMREKLEQSLEGLHHKFRVNRQIFDGREAEETIYSRHPEEIVARVPKDLKPLVLEYRRKLPKDKLPVFISRRFLSGERRDRIARRVHEVLRACNCEPVEAQLESGNYSTPITQVAAKMWLARAGIVLVSSAEGGGRAFGVNLAHEAGFLQGQGKQVLVLVEEGCSDEMREWTNVTGLIAPTFAAGDRAFLSEAEDSIDRRIRNWLERIHNVKQQWC